MRCFWGSRRFRSSLKIMFCHQINWQMLQHRCVQVICTFSYFCCAWLQWSHLTIISLLLFHLHILDPHSRCVAILRSRVCQCCDCCLCCGRSEDGDWRVCALGIAGKWWWREGWWIFWWWLGSRGRSYSCQFGWRGWHCGILRLNGPVQQSGHENLPIPKWIHDVSLYGQLWNCWQSFSMFGRWWASATITARFFHLVQLEFKVVCHAYNMCIHIWAVTTCGVRFDVVNLERHDLNWCGCVQFAFHAFLIAEEVIRCNMAICVE